MQSDFGEDKPRHIRPQLGFMHSFRGAEAGVDSCFAEPQKLGFTHSFAEPRN